MTRFTKPAYAELEYKHRFHFVSVLYTATKVKKINIVPLLNYTLCHEDVRGSGGYRSTLFLITVLDGGALRREVHTITKVIFEWHFFLP